MRTKSIGCASSKTSVMNGLLLVKSSLIRFFLKVYRWLMVLRSTVGVDVKKCLTQLLMERGGHWEGVVSLTQLAFIFFELVKYR